MRIVKITDRQIRGAHGIPLHRVHPVLNPTNPPTFKASSLT
jgi:hypothetical protein